MEHEQSLDVNNPRGFIDTYLIEMKKQHGSEEPIFTGVNSAYQELNYKIITSFIFIILKCRLECFDHFTTSFAVDSDKYIYIWVEYKAGVRLKIGRRQAKIAIVCRCFWNDGGLGEIKKEIN
jgi:hypothetical protein